MKDVQVLSVYLSSDNKQTPLPDYLLTQFHSLIHQNLTETQKNKWSRGISSIERYIRESFDRSNTRTLVFFTGKNLWQVLNFEFYIPPACRILSAVYLKPLEEILDRYQKYLVLLVDRKKAKLFTVHLGKIEEQKEVFDGEVPQRVKAETINLGRTDKIMRDIEYHVHHHLQIIAESTKEFIKGKNIHSIILGGHADQLHKLKKHLTYPLNQMIKGEFVTELNIPLNKILALSKKVALEIYTSQR